MYSNNLEESPDLFRAVRGLTEKGYGGYDLSEMQDIKCHIPEISFFVPKALPKLETMSRPRLECQGRVNFSQVYWEVSKLALSIQGTCHLCIC
jgi:hypothetical protein